MKRTSTQQPIIPSGWTGRNWPSWLKYIDKEVAKINGTPGRKLVKA